MNLSIDAWVVLPDHLHCVWTLPDGDDDNANRWRVIKQGFSKALPMTERRLTVRLARGEKGFTRQIGRYNRLLKTSWVSVVENSAGCKLFAYGAKRQG